MSRLRQVLGLALTLHAAGCAAIFKGGSQDVTFVSVPDGSDVRVDGRFKGETPTKARIDRNQSTNVVVSKDGFAPQYVTVQRHPDTPWWIWDIATCAVPVLLCIPLAVDALSGAWFSLDEEITVKLDVLPLAPRPQAPSSTPSESVR